MVGRSSGVVLMAPPTDHPEAAASISTLLSTLKPKQKVRLPFSSASCPSHARLALNCLAPWTAATAPQPQEQVAVMACASFLLAANLQGVCHEYHDNELNNG